jgi:glycerol kinase
MRSAHLQPRDLAAIGITNQRETTVVWDRRSGGVRHTTSVASRARADAVPRGLQSG